ncbi:MAG: hypothetical protein KBC15_02165 [Candidatus Levybacteria bacterium]|nr:hypothetical protein [Candidatus Levybacteria bacterium]
MKKACFASALVLLLLVVGPQSIFAVGLEFSAPSQITDQPFSVDAVISGASFGQNYVRVDLYKDGTTEYFAETFNGSSWVDGSDGRLYLPVHIASNQAQITIQARVGNPSSSKYQGSGSYKLRVRRYTASGSVAANDSYVPLDIAINYIFPTPTSTQITPSSTPRVVTATPVKASSTLAVATLSEEVDKEEIVTRTYPTAVLGIDHERDLIVTPTRSVSQVSGDDKIDLLPAIFFLAGGGFIASCGILIYRNWRLKS